MEFMVCRLRAEIFGLFYQRYHQTFHSPFEISQQVVMLLCTDIHGFWLYSNYFGDFSFRATPSLTFVSLSKITQQPMNCHERIGTHIHSPLRMNCSICSDYFTIHTVSSSGKTNTGFWPNTSIINNISINLTFPLFRTNLSIWQMSNCI